MLLTSIFLSQSRGAILIAIAVMGAALLLRIKSRSWMFGIAALVVVLVPVIYQATFTTQYARDRVTTGFIGSAQDRLTIQLETARAVIASRGIGIGAGGFEKVFPLFRHESPTTTGIWNAAHGSYIEWPFTYGIPWTLLLVASAAGIMTTIIRARPVTGGSNVALPVLVLIACLLHISYDFGLQLLGLTVIVAALGGSSWSRAVASRSKPSRRPAPVRPAPVRPAPVRPVAEPKVAA